MIQIFYQNFESVVYIRFIQLFYYRHVEWSSTRVTRQKTRPLQLIFFFIVKTFLKIFCSEYINS